MNKCFIGGFPVSEQAHNYYIEKLREKEHVIDQERYANDIAENVIDQERASNARLSKIISDITAKATKEATELNAVRYQLEHYKKLSEALFELVEVQMEIMAGYLE